MMVILLISLVVLAVIALLLGVARNHSIRKKIARGELEEYPETSTIPDPECCGQHELCEKDSLLAAVSKELEYYDDEELDHYKGIQGNAYIEEQVEEFRDVLYTMDEIEVAGWVRSLQLRGIELPDALKDEVFLIVGERRLPVLGA